MQQEHRSVQRHERHRRFSPSCHDSCRHRSECGAYSAAGCRHSQVPPRQVHRVSCLRRVQSSLDDGVALSVEELQHRLTLVDAKAPCVRVGGWQRRRRHRGGGHGGRGSRRRPAAAAAIWRGAAAGSGQTPAPPPPQREGAQAVGKRGAARGGRGFWARGIARAGGRRRVAAKGPAVVQWGPLFGTPLSHIRGRCLDLSLQHDRSLDSIPVNSTASRQRDLVVKSF